MFDDKERNVRIIIYLQNNQKNMFFAQTIKFWKK